VDFGLSSRPEQCCLVVEIVVKYSESLVLIDVWAGWRTPGTSISCSKDDRTARWGEVHATEEHLTLPCTIRVW